MTHAALVQVKRGVYLLVAFASIAMLQWARAFFIPLTFALLLSLCLNTLVTRMRRLHIPRALGAGLLLCCLLYTSDAADE